MKLFQCQSCGNPVYFDNVACERCGAWLGFHPETETLMALRDAGDSVWLPVRGDGAAYRFCANATHGVCNWLVPADSPGSLCIACEHNRGIPDLSVPENITLWRKIEAQKHRLIYSLIRLGLRIPPDTGSIHSGLIFDFLADIDPDNPVMTGHADGLITLNIAEADDAEREARRTAMGEPYRTLLGHFRHEVGHYYWNVLVRDADTPDRNRLEDFRALFGDEREDYGQALTRHYETGPPADWQHRFVSAYASAHPWEDFAETWAHYLHIVDTLETAGAFGVQINPTEVYEESLQAIVWFDPYRHVDFDQILKAWFPLTFAVNSLNRSMGLPDLYPFVLAPPAIRKLEFIHVLVHGPKPSGWT